MFYTQQACKRTYLRQNDLKTLPKTAILTLRWRLQ